MILASTLVFAATASQPDAIEAIRADLEHRAATEQFSGAVLIARDNATLLESAYGFADRERQVRNTPGTRFRFGSMGKMFTAVAVMQLVQAGKVRLDDPVGKFLADYPNADVASVTIEQLLTHTGGTGDIFGPGFGEHRHELKELADYVKWFGQRGTRFPPGTRHEYSNYGFILLGRVVEVVSGLSYDEYVARKVFGPAKMAASGNQPEQPPIANLAVSYMRGDGPMRGGGPGPGPGPGPGAPPPGSGPLRSAVEFLPYRGTSAGGGYSSVGDLLRFARALEAHQLLDATLTEKMTTGHVDTPRPGLRYGFGFEEETLASGACRIGHGGGAPGMNGVLWIFPGAKVVVAVLANLDPPAAQDVARYIVEQLSL
jgi:CubicO group peptidase (beta-lactamase class C family)